jgi:hypothetical protein
MKILKLFIPFVTFVFIAYYFFVKPKYDTKATQITGRVIMIRAESKRSGLNIIEVQEKEEVRYVNYSFMNNKGDVEVGDSIFKQPYQPLFIKKKADSILRIANDQNALIN